MSVYQCMINVLYKQEIIIRVLNWLYNMKIDRRIYVFVNINVSLVFNVCKCNTKWQFYHRINHFESPIKYLTFFRKKQRQNETKLERTYVPIMLTFHQKFLGMSTISDSLFIFHMCKI